MWQDLRSFIEDDHMHYRTTKCQLLLLFFSPSYYGSFIFSSQLSILDGISEAVKVICIRAQQMLCLYLSSLFIRIGDNSKKQ